MSEYYERLQRLHSLLGKPREAHDRLYKAYPTAFGVSGRCSADSAWFEASLILALHLAGRDGAQNLHKVYFLVPTAIEKKVLTLLRSSAEKIFGRLKNGTSVPAIKHFGELFRQLMLGSLIWTLPEEPERWVAYGFAKSDNIPEWMRAKLIEVPETSSGLESGV